MKESKVVQGSGPSAQAGLFLLVGTLVALWAFLVIILRYHWGSESYYNFGPAVPVLGLFLFYRRWKTDTCAWDYNERRYQVTLLLTAVLIFLLVPLRLLAEVNPFWRVPLLAQAGLIAGISLLLLYGYGGWKKLCHFAFPLLFLLFMLPWPWRVETAVIQAFTVQVVDTTVILLKLIGYPAMHMGNVIRIGEDIVGVDEACSGIRSLQALGVAAFFLGEFFALRWIARGLLLGVTLFLVFLFNTARSLTLTLIILNEGHAAYDKWHDPVGMITYVGSLAALYGFAELFAYFSRHPEPDAPPLSLASLPAPPRLGTALLLGLALAHFAVVEGWFRYHEATTPPAADWGLAWPEAEAGRLEFIPMPEAVQEVLGYDTGTRLRYTLSDTAVLDLYSYAYSDDNRLASVSSYGHSPTVCLQASGAELIDEVEALRIRVGELEIPLRHALFTYEDRQHGPTRIQTFYCVWERRNMGLSSNRLRDLDYAFQWDQVRAGRRDYSRQVLLIAIYGIESVAKARAVTRSLLRETVPITPVGSDSLAEEAL
jgi:exosortase